MTFFSLARLFYIWRNFKVSLLCVVEIVFRCKHNPYKFLNSFLIKKLDPLPLMWPHPTPEYQDLANLIAPNCGPHCPRGKWLEQFEFSLSGVSFTQVLAFLVKHFLSRKLHFLLSKNIFHPYKDIPLSFLSFFLNQEIHTHVNVFLF